MENARDILEHAALDALFERALREDGHDLDITTLSCRLPRTPIVASVRARQPMTLAGLEAIPALLHAAARDIRFTPLAHDSERIEAGDTIATIEGPPADVLVLERPILNTLSKLSGIATRTRAFADAIPQGSPARVYDTRKTTPAWRHLEKYAVVCGGGASHRMGLHDAILIKDNHLAARPAEQPLADFLTDVCERARREFDPDFIEIEVDTLDQLADILTLGHPLIDAILLDNFSIEQLNEAVRWRNERAPEIQLEASGNVSLDTITDIARSGVERISVGGLTHQATWVDIGLDFDH